MKYRKKPVVIEAFKWSGKSWEIPEPFRHHRDIDIPVMSSADYDDAADGIDSSLCIQTLEGRMTAQVGDWVIMGIKGEVYPCKPDIFELTYEPA